MTDEGERLNFIENRDGKEAMLRFAEQTLSLYVNASIERSQYKDSIKELKHILELNGFKVDLVKVQKGL